MLRSFAVVAVALLAASLAFGGTIKTKEGTVKIDAGVKGSVVDDNGAAVKDAEVSVRKTPGGGKFTMGKTDRAGKFDFAFDGKAGDEVEVVVTWTDSKGTKHSITGKTKL